MSRLSAQQAGGWLIVFVACLFHSQVGHSEFAAPADTAIGRHGMVVSVSPLATEIGVDILKAGGNAVDAAVAVAFALAVTYPEAGNIGGGGFMLVYPGGAAEPVCVDYRETAPSRATSTMFADDPRGSALGHRYVGTPGTVRGLALAHSQFGKLSWRDVVAPAVRLAAEGFAIDQRLAESLNREIAAHPTFTEFCRVFGRPDGIKWRTGDRLSQPELARTLERLRDEGPDAFYTGLISQQIVAEMLRGHGDLSATDLENYQAKLRKPIHGEFRGLDVYGPPPPSSGGIALVEMLNILENFDLKKLGRWSPETNHLIIEAMRRAYADRARWLGDPDFVEIPPSLTDKGYAKSLADEIDRDSATSSVGLWRDLPITVESPHTTHFSVIDRDGMAVANTYTLEDSFGSRVVVAGAGFLLNNEMGDFNPQPGKTNASGMIGTDANLVAPGKRMLSSQSPTIFARNGRAILVTGSPGGRTIINTVLCVALNVFEFDMQLRAAVDAPRLHHAWLPDQVLFEAVDDPAHAQLVAGLRSRGHSVAEKSGFQGDAHSILVRDGVYHGVADRRIVGAAAGY